MRGKRPYFFVQTKTTTITLNEQSRHLAVSTKARDIERLLKLPGPTYVIGVHEPTRRTSIRSVHTSSPEKAITRIPLAYELSPSNLKALHDEVRKFWETLRHKPTESRFA